MYEYRLSQSGNYIAVKTKIGWGRIASVHGDEVVLLQMKQSMLGGEKLTCRELVFNKPEAFPLLTEIVGNARLHTGPKFPSGLPVMPYDDKYLPVIQVKDDRHLAQCGLFKSRSAWLAQWTEPGIAVVD